MANAPVEKITHLIFDFDNTLYNTEKRKEFFWQMASVHGYSSVDAYRMYNEARLRGEKINISLESYLEILTSNIKSDQKTFKEAEVNNIIIEMEQGDNLLPGAALFVEWALQENFVCYLLSLGVPDWQEMKFQQSGLSAYFPPDHVIFTEDFKQGKKEAVLTLFGGMFNGKGAVLINDKPDETRELLVHFPKIQALVRREKRDRRYQKKDFDSLVKDFPGRVEWRENLSELHHLLAHKS